VAAMGLVKLNSDLVGRIWINERPSGAIRWEGEDSQLGRSGSGVWKADIFKTVAPACVG
jgi:hypothetical protein